jgi:uncharacterized caspase-like protein
MTRKAFLVGINDYRPAGAGGPDLNGCVNDVKDMANTLVICGFEPKNIRLCTDRSATRENMMKGLAWLTSGSQTGDSLVFFYSGHGSQVADTNADEVDRSDEILCPHDIDFARRIYITDDDLRQAFAGLAAAANLEVILDSCHSGTATRELAEPPAGPERIRTQKKFLPPPVDYSFHIDYEPNLVRRRIMRNGNPHKEAVIVPGLNHTLWAACKDNQTSEETEIEGKVRGVFTCYFCKILRRTNGTIVRAKLDRLLTAALKREGFEQVPQLETSKEELRDKPFV